MTATLSSRAAPAGRRRRSSDWLWGGAGVTIASASAGFAAYMIATAPTEVTGTGSKDFGIFAHFDKRTRIAATTTPPVPPTREQAMPPSPGPAVARARSPAGQEIDDTPTGSIGPARSEGAVSSIARTTAAATALNGFILREVSGNRALIEHRNKLSLVRPGSILDEAGEVLSIERRGDLWVVHTASGTIGER